MNLSKENKAKIILASTSVLGALLLLTFSIFLGLPYIYVFLFLFFSAFLFILSELYLRIQHNVDRKNDFIAQMIKRNFEKEEYVKNFSDSVNLFKKEVVDFLSKVIEKMEKENFESKIILEKIKKSQDENVENFKMNFKLLNQQVNCEKEELFTKTFLKIEETNKSINKLVDKEYFNRNTEIMLNYLTNMHQKIEETIEKNEKIG